jgi:ElaB/YqjD/DUF883 family membrane-anchored ribosome-binding protein
MGQRADRVGHETPGDEFAQGRGWSAGDEEDPTMLNEPGLAGLENDIGTANRAHDGEVIYEEADVVEVQPATTTGDRGDTTDDRTPETEAIRSDIEDTRANMSSTIDEIQDRLSPQRLKDQATDAVREATVGRVQNMASNITETARDTGSTLMDTIRENPLPAALLGIGAGWLFMNTRRNAAERDRWRARYEPGYYDRGYGRYGRYGRYGPYGPYGRSASGYPYDHYGQYGSSQSSQQDNGKMSQMADTAKDKLSDVGDRAQEMTDTVKERASDMAEQAQWQAQRARGWLERTWDENPLVVAGAALAAGALIGLSIPETAVERDMMGEASGNVLQKAASAAQDVTQTATQKAQEAISQADQTMSQQAQSSQQPMSGSRQSSAGSSGPSSQSAEDKLRTAQENIDSARSSLESGSGSQGSSQSERKSSGSSR